MIIPIGAQNMLVLNQGLTVGLPRALFAVVFAGLCDTLLIVIGAAGLSGALTSVPGLRPALLVFGVVFLAYLAVQSFRQPAIAETTIPGGSRVRDIAIRTAGVSLLNPHAILDTVIVIGAVIASQPETGRMWFASGTLSASWFWFLFLVLAGGIVRRWLSPQRMIWVNIISGAILAVFAGILMIELINTLK